MIQTQGAPTRLWGRPVPVGPGRLRKVAIIGSHAKTIYLAPWADPTWEFWVHSSTALLVPPGRATRLYDVHPAHVFKVARKNGFADYFDYIKRLTIPIYMDNQYQDIPASKKYPYELVRTLWPDMPIGSQTAFMTAHALVEGVTHLGYWGIHMDHAADREGRPNAEQWVGIARGLGVQIVIPQQSPFCHEPREIYAYETHKTPEQYAKRLETLARDLENFGDLKPKALVDCNTPEMEAQMRAKRMEDPQYAEAINSLSAQERVIVAELEARERARAQLQPDAGGGAAAAGVPPGGDAGA